MNPILKNILAVVAGIIFGGVLNMGIIQISSAIIPPPDGVDLTTMEGLKAGMHLFKPINFLMPFIAHSLGTLTGAFLTTIIAVNHKIKLALIIGAFFMIGGIINILILPSPLWFTIIDLLIAYIPMAYLASIIGISIKKSINN